MILNRFYLILFFAFGSLLGCSQAQGRSQEQCTGLELIVWNVGQGQWVTLRDEKNCWHYDTGGERAPWREIEHVCANRQNFAHFSHWDWDHVSFMKRAARRLRGFCIRKMPAGSASPNKQKLLEGIPLCPSVDESLSEELTRSETRPETRIKRAKATANDLSRVFQLARSSLVPGDSTSAQEKSWALRLHQNRASESASIRRLVLGHHGSRTSTSQFLLDRVPELRQAIASARKAKYGHPHLPVVLRLKKHGVALITTEEWGSIHMALSEKKKPESETPAFCEQDEMSRSKSAVKLTPCKGGIPCRGFERPARSEHGHRKRSSP